MSPLAWSLRPWYWWSQAVPTGSVPDGGGCGRLVVVTGCDSGIGYSLAQALVTWGFAVLATVLDPEGAAARKLRVVGVTVVKLDLRLKGATHGLLKLVQSLKKQGHSLWCVVNNAGVMTYAPFEWQTEYLILGQLEVNLAGAILVTRTLINELKRTKGRVVMVSSPQGIVASPNMSVYCASKWGLEGFSQALRRELAPAGVCVIVVRPNSLPRQTGILRRNADQLLEMSSEMDFTKQEDLALLKALETGFRKEYTTKEDVQLIHDERLMQSFREAILDPVPEMSYMAAPFLVRVLLQLASHLPVAWMDVIVSWNIHIKVIEMGAKH